MKSKFSSTYSANRDVVLSFLNDFQTSGTLFGNGDRNTIKLFELNGQTINIKSFKIPNLINKISISLF